MILKAGDDVVYEEAAWKILVDLDEINKAIIKEDCIIEVKVYELSVLH